MQPAAHRVATQGGVLMPARAASVCPSIRASRRGLRLRAVTPADERAITRVRAAAIRALAGGHYSPVQLAAWIGMRQPRRPTATLTPDAQFAAWRARRLIGYVAVSLGERPHILALYVDPGHGCRGIGSHLLRAAERHVAAAGHDRIWVTASCNAVGFYRQRNYTQDRPFSYTVHDRHHGAVTLDAVALEKPLTPLQGATPWKR